MVDRTHLEMLRRRLATHRLCGNPLATPADVVGRLTCVQSQECGHAFFSLGLRSRAATYAAVQAEFDAGRFVRTHILRPTWHFVAAGDLAWIQALTAPRVQRLNAGLYRREGLDRARLDRSVALITSWLAGGAQLTRSELAARLGGEGFPTRGIGLAYVIMNAELEAVICSGAMRGAQHTYALGADRLPAATTQTAPTAEAACAELIRRFVVGHGPASVRDFCRWSSLTLTEARAGLALVRDGFEVVRIENEELFFVDDAVPGPQRGALLLPLYDELTSSYPALGFPMAERHPHPPGEDTFVGSIIVAETNVGRWRRSVKGRRVEIELWVAPGVDARQRTAVADAAEELADFLELEPTVSWPG